jgi:hypothetical protein
MPAAALALDATTMAAMALNLSLSPPAPPKQKFPPPSSEVGRVGSNLPGTPGGGCAGAAGASIWELGAMGVRCACEGEALGCHSSPSVFRCGWGSLPGYTGGAPDIERGVGGRDGVSSPPLVPLGRLLLLMRVPGACLLGTARTATVFCSFLVLTYTVYESPRMNIPASVDKS